MTNGTIGATGNASGITFGAWLKQRRKDQGIGPDQFAELLGCSTITLLKIEAGERRPSRQLAELLATHLHISADEVEPFIAFARMGHAATSGDVSGIAARAPWRTARSHLTNLPSALTSFVGREEDVAKARSLLLQSKVRLLSLTGAPGIGKTRLALEVASSLAGNFDDGVFLVELAPVSEPDLLPATIVRALGLKEEALQRIEGVLLQHMRERRMLLVLDNFEHLLDAAPSVVRLLENSPWLKVLVTSREALHVRGERRLPVPPLSVPHGPLPTVEALALYSSVALFVERAETVLPNFRLTEANAADVAAICAGLEGLPLALELAAARLEQFPPREMRASLSSRLNLLTGGERDLPLRQRTLGSAIEWSYSLLGRNEQQLLRLLGTFAGGFTLEAAAALSQAPLCDVQDLLGVLVDKNLIRRETRAGETGYGMLEVIREYAMQMLTRRGEAESIRLRHARYYMEQAEENAPELSGPKGPRWLSWFEVEHDNMRAALNWLLDTGHEGTQAEQVEHVEMGIRMCAALWLFWKDHGHLYEARQMFGAALEAVSIVTGSPEPSMEAALRCSPTLPSRWATAFSGAGVMAMEQGDTAAALESHSRSLALRQEIGDKAGIASSLFNLGTVALYRGEYEVARRYHEESLALARVLDNTWKIALSLNSLGIIECDTCHFAEARQFYTESLAIGRELDDLLHVGMVLNNLGLLTGYQQDYATARTLLAESLEIHRELEDKAGFASAYLNLGFVARDEGKQAEAQSLFLDALRLVWELGDKRLLAECFEGLAGLAGMSHQSERAAKLAGAGARLREKIGIPMAPSEQARHSHYIALAREHLSSERWVAALKEGAALDLGGAVDYALSTTP